MPRRSLVVVFAAADRPAAVALAKHFPDDPVDLVEVGAHPRGPEAVTAPAARATDVVILWSTHCARNPQLPWLLNPSLIHRLGHGLQLAIWLFRLDDSQPPLDLAAFSLGGGVPDTDLIAAKLRGRPPVPPTGEPFFGRSEYARTFDGVYYGRGSGLLWLHGLAGVGKRTLARRQAARYDPHGHRTQRVTLRPGMHEVELDLHVVAGLRETTVALHDLRPVDADASPADARRTLQQHVKSGGAHVAIWVFEDAHHLLRDDQTPNDVLLRLLLDLRDTAEVTERRCLVVLTSTRRPRLPVELAGLSVVTEVRGLDPVDGVNLLRSRGAEWVDEDVLTRCAVELDGHPLALEIAAPSIADGQHDWEQSRVRVATEVLASTLLQEPTRALLEVLAVVDGPIRPERLAGYLGLAEPDFRTALADAVSYSLVEDGDDGYLQLHPLVRDYFLQDFRQRTDQRERASALADAGLELLGELRPGSRLHVRCALATFRLLGLALRIQEARSLRANLLGPLFEAGVELYRQQRWAEAQANFEVVVSWYRDHLDAHLYLARCHARRGDLRAARAVIHDLLEEHPDDKQVLRVAGRIEAIARDWPAAIRFYTLARERGGDFPPLLQDLAEALVHVGQWRQARDALERVVTAGRADAYTFGLLGRVHERLGALREALDCTRLACRYDRRNPRYLRQLGDVSRRARHHLQASTAYRQALQHQPGHPEVTLALAGTLLDLGDHEQARRLLGTVRPGALPGQGEHQLATARLALADGHLDQARRIAARGFGGLGDPHLLRSAAELQLALAEAGEVDWSTTRRRVADLTERLRQAGGIVEAEEVARRLEREPAGAGPRADREDRGRGR